MLYYCWNELTLRCLYRRLFQFCTFSTINIICKYRANCRCACLATMQFMFGNGGEWAKWKLKSIKRISWTFCRRQSFNLFTWMLLNYAFLFLFVLLLFLKIIMCTKKHKHKCCKSFNGSWFLRSNFKLDVDIYINHWARCIFEKITYLLPALLQSGKYYFSFAQPCHIASKC